MTIRRFGWVVDRISVAGRRTNVCNVDSEKHARAIYAEQRARIRRGQRVELLCAGICVAAYDQRANEHVAMTGVPIESCPKCGGEDEEPTP